MGRLRLSSTRKTESAWDVALKILRYLAENPHAADTTEGIIEWWLLDRMIVEQEDIVESALHLLVERNLIVAEQAADARYYYHLNAKQIQEIRKLIGEAEAERP